MMYSAMRVARSQTMTARQDGSAIQNPWSPSRRVHRYSNFALPTSRYLPGVNVRPDDQTIPFEEAFKFGVDLFNHACWWEAHEVWEGFWIKQAPQSLERLAVELLINAANLNLKILLGKPEAAGRLAKGLDERYTEWRRRGGGIIFEIDIPNWYSAYQAYIARICRSATPTHSCAEFPFLVLDRSNPST